jgi:hypothetical protein
MLMDVPDPVDETLAARDVARSAFGGPFIYQDFVLDFNTTGRAEHRMKTRIFWHRRSYVGVDRVVVRHIR